MATTPIQRGAHQTVLWEYLDTDGSPRPFQAGDYGELCIGAVTPNGTAELVSKATNVSGEGSTVVGSPIATFYLLPADGDALPGSSTVLEFWLVTAAGLRKKIGNPCTVQILGRVCANP